MCFKCLKFFHKIKIITKTALIASITILLNTFNILRQEKYLAKWKNFYLVLVDFEKAFDQVPRDVLWWAL